MGGANEGLADASAPQSTAKAPIKKWNKIKAFDRLITMRS